MVFLFGVMGYQLPSGKPSLKSSYKIRVLTVNLGEGGEINKVAQHIEKIKPDIIAFQEVEHFQRAQIQGAVPEGWEVVFDEHLGVASHFKIRDFETKNRRFLGDWGGVVGRAELNAGRIGVINFFTVHLDSPREGVEALIRERFKGIVEMQKVTEDQIAESILAAKWAGSFENVIVAGDFNMLDANPIYHKYWSHFRNAFAQGGVGFGYTKHTRWHGVRIDHILTDKNWRILSAQVGPSFGGDHHPVSSEIIFNGKLLEQPLKDEETVSLMVPSGIKIFILEEFEENPGLFTKFSEAELSVDRNEKFKHGKTLKIQSEALLDSLSTGIHLERLMLEQFSKMSFSYKIPKGLAVGMRVQTQFDDWICIGGTSSDLCPHPKSKQAFNFVDDNQWHEISVDLKTLVQSLLPAVKYIKAIQFYVHKTNSLFDQFWIDDFMITE
ncbi:MAG: endonuclease/exonuclease/phosphatase family protein [Candidatus Omnitrophica bacterium]|nr:endonuclease/exonuclease/phosphatase family protein [Candidatus Omnitrophota bacterium]